MYQKQQAMLFTKGCGVKPCAGLKVWPATAPPRSEEARTRTIIQCGGPHRTATFYI